MAKIDNTNANIFKELFRRLRALETASPIGSSSVTRGALRIASIEGLIVEGSAKVTGLFKGVGTFLWENIFNVTGTATFTGTTNLDGPVDIDGNVALKGDLAVKAGGSVTVEGTNPVKLGVADNGFPGLQFPAGALTAASSSIQMQSGNAAIGATDGQASMVVGAVGMGVNASGTSILGAFNTDGIVNMLSLPTVSATGKTPNLWVDGNGKVWRLI